MRKSMGGQLLAVAILGGAGGLVQAEQARVVSPPAMRDVVAVEVTGIHGGVIEGRLTNLTPHRVHAPELMAKYDWLWHDDHHPGPNDPGWVTYTVVAGELGPRESTDFVIDPGRPLPARTDGVFMTSVAVTRLTEFRPVDGN